MAQGGGTRSPYPPADPFLEQNVTDMATVMKSEAPDAAAQQMIGWTLINRMKQQHAVLVASVVGTPKHPS